MGELHGIPPPTAAAPVPAVIQFWNVDPDEKAIADRVDTYGSSVVPSRSNSSEYVVPGGYSFVVTSVGVTPRDLSPNPPATPSYELRINPTSGGSATAAAQFPQTTVTGTWADGVQTVSGGSSPALIIRPGQGVKCVNDSDSDGSIRVVLYGFFVSDLAAYFSR